MRRTHDEWPSLVSILTRTYSESGRVRWVVVEEFAKEIDRGPDGFSINGLRRGADDDPNEANNRETKRDRKKLG